MPPKPSAASAFSSLTFTVTPLPASSLRAAAARSAGCRALAGSLDRSLARLVAAARTCPAARAPASPPGPRPPARGRPRHQGQGGQLGRPPGPVGLGLGVLVLVEPVGGQQRPLGHRLHGGGRVGGQRLGQGGDGLAGPAALADHRGRGPAQHLGVDLGPLPHPDQQQHGGRQPAEGRQGGRLAGLAGEPARLQQRRHRHPEGGHRLLGPGPSSGPGEHRHGEQIGLGADRVGLGERDLHGPSNPPSVQGAARR